MLYLGVTLFLACITLYLTHKLGKRFKSSIGAVITKMRAVLTCFVFSYLFRVVYLTVYVLLASVFDIDKEKKEELSANMYIFSSFYLIGE